MSNGEFFPNISEQAISRPMFGPKFRLALRMSSATAAIAMPVLLAAGAFAQTAPSTEQANTAPLQAVDNSDIVVTAQRREESLSKVPLSVAALSADTLQTR